ncbi:MAG: hypothetical protein WDZ64_00065 [Parcubacteria group bacterium]
MPKNIEDVIMPEKRRSIRDIPIPDGRKRGDKDTFSVPVRKISDSVVSGDMDKTPPPNNPSSPPPRKGRSKKRLLISIIISALIIAFALLSFFSGATLAYIPKSSELSFSNEAFTAYKTGERGPLFSIAKITADDGVTVSASGEREVNRKASGVIIVYNNAGTESQRLIATTRFETPAGQVYRIEDAIVVPGRRTVDGTVVPGSLEVTVYADEAGDEYNIGLSDFTLPGLRGTTNYDTIYARSKTPMSGGFVGMEKVVSDEDLSRAEGELETLLRSKLLAEVGTQVPEDLVLIPSLSFFSFEDLPQTAGTSNSNVTINKRGTLNGVMFKRSDLSKELALKKITLSADDSVNIENIDSLNFAFMGTPPQDIFSAEELNFTVSGSGNLLWRTDEVALRADLLGRHKREVSSILNNYPTVESASVTIRPFWKTSFPDKNTLISIKKIPVQ